MQPAQLRKLGVNFNGWRLGGWRAADAQPLHERYGWVEVRSLADAAQLDRWAAYRADLRTAIQADWTKCNA